jgi:uncharacterized membrane protein YgaE (UPF0421/DUF939 family)
MTGEPPVDQARRAAQRGRRALTTRLGRLRAMAWQVGQAAVAAGAAWFVAADLSHHPSPALAPVVAVVCLGMSYGQRLRRVVEVTLGAGLGVVVADLFVRVAGRGVWQLAVVVAVAMLIAIALGAGGLVVSQAAVQGIFVVALAPPPGQMFTRWLDVVIGGAVAVLAATAVPAAPLRRPRVLAAAVAQIVADLLRSAAQAARDGDVTAAAAVLTRARGTEPLIRELESAADEGRDAVAGSPFLRSGSEQVRQITDVIDPLDRALRGTRVMVRRILVAISVGGSVPQDYLVVIGELATAVEILSQVLSDNGSLPVARPPLLAVAAATGRLPRTGELSLEVVLAQVRSVVVDLLQVAGMDVDEATAALPPVLPA